MPEIENGCLWIGIQTTDYLLEWFDDSLPKLFQQDDVIYEYNQYKQQWSKKSCTIFSAVGAISDLFNYQFSLDEIKEIDELSYSKWRLKDSWWWVQSAVKLVADRWNERMKDKVAYYRVSLNDNDLVKSILDKWYTLMTSFQWNGKYVKDYMEDNILNWTTFWSATFGHAINVRNIKGKRSCKDSSAWSKENIYELEHLLSEITCYSPNAYIYTKVKEDTLEDLKRLNEIKAKILEVMPINSELWHLTNSEEYKDKLHQSNNMMREWLEYINNELKKYK